jgi:hypothetical protein
VLTHGSRARARAQPDDTGAITVLVIGYVAIALALIVVGIDVSKVFLAERALSAAADSAALAAAQGVDRTAVYDGSGLRCGSRLPLDAARATALATGSVADNDGDLQRSFSRLDAPVTDVTGGTATVRLSGAVGVPFGRVLGWLDPSTGGRVGVSETSHAQSPVAGAAGC